MKHTMIDLETMGSSPGCAIVSIGAVEFDPVTRGLGKEFYQNVDLQSCLDLGLKAEGATVMWWMQQSELSRQALMPSRVSLMKALTDFSDWLHPETLVWSHGASFDLPVLGAAYQILGRKKPWAWRNERDTRTAMMLTRTQAPLPHETAHHALEDAKRQAHTIIVALFKQSKMAGEM